VLLSTVYLTVYIRNYNSAAFGLGIRAERKYVAVKVWILAVAERDAVRQVHLLPVGIEDEGGVLQARQVEIRAEVRRLVRAFSFPSDAEVDREAVARLVQAGAAGREYFAAPVVRCKNDTVSLTITCGER